MKTLSILLFASFFGINLFTNSELANSSKSIAPPADTLKSVVAGDFNTAATWDQNRTPTATDYVVCRHAVVFDGDCHLYDKRIETGVTVVYSANCHIYFRM
jgi:hypothetical protein